MNKEFSISGSKALLNAFAEEVNLKFYTKDSITYDYIGYCDFEHTLQGIPKKLTTHFNLPEQWNEAIAFYKSITTPLFYTEENTSIYSGDKCWAVWKDENGVDMSYYYHEGIPVNNTEKYFSNEKNARIYYNQLKWEGKLKFKVGDTITSNTHYAKTIVEIDYNLEHYVGENNKIICCFNAQDRWRLYQEKTPEQQANELGFKVGDKVWNKYTKEYENEIIGFDFDKERDLILLLPNNDYGYPCKITNKVAIHTPTKEDKEFIKQKFSIKNNGYCSENNVNVCFFINLPKNKHVWGYEPDIRGEYLILSVDEYIQAIREKPLFVTEDGKNIYSGMTYWYLDKTNPKEVNSTNTYSGEPYKFRVYFLTKEAAEQYLLNIKFKEWSQNSSNQDTLCDSCHWTDGGTKSPCSQHNMCEGSSCEETAIKFFEEEFTIEKYNEWKKSLKPKFKLKTGQYIYNLDIEEIYD